MFFYLLLNVLTYIIYVSQFYVNYSGIRTACTSQ